MPRKVSIPSPYIIYLPEHPLSHTAACHFTHQEYIKSVRAVGDADGVDASALADLPTEPAGLEDAIAESDVALLSEPLPSGNATIMATTELPKLEIENERADVRMAMDMAAEYKSLEDISVAAWEESDLPDEAEVSCCSQHLPHAMFTLFTPFGHRWLHTASLIGNVALILHSQNIKF